MARLSMDEMKQILFSCETQKLASLTLWGDECPEATAVSFDMWHNRKDVNSCASSSFWPV